MRLWVIKCLFVQLRYSFLCGMKKRCFFYMDFKCHNWYFTWALIPYRQFVLVLFVSDSLRVISHYIFVFVSHSICIYNSKWRKERKVSLWSQNKISWNWQTFLLCATELKSVGIFWESKILFNSMLLSTLVYLNWMFLSFRPLFIWQW